MGQRYRRAAMLAIVGIVQTAALIAVYVEFVTTPLGQLLDSASVTGGRVGFAQIEPVVSALLDIVMVASLLAAVIAVAIVGLLRRRYLLAAATSALVLGANITTQVLKHVVLHRPDLGVSLSGGIIGAPSNTLPSGHTTAAASVAVAFTLVVPPRLRAPVGVLGGAYAALTGMATLTAGWHRPSDAIAAYIVVGIWAAVVGIAVLLFDHRHQALRPVAPRPPRGAMALLAFVAVACLVAGSLALALIAQIPAASIGKAQLVVAYAGGAALTAGAAAAVFTVVLGVSGWLAPERGPRLPRQQRPSRARARTGPIA
ncbi:MAG: phosphatase PAP2 family protein [Streptosporangiales bacterium]